ncbi:hypothetical protein [Flavobacterium subsaxonicum]|nr:hypothetical protein [Flavobacterium subsaxonicum]
MARVIIRALAQCFIVIALFLIALYTAIPERMVIAKAKNKIGSNTMPMN